MLFQTLLILSLNLGLINPLPFMFPSLRPLFSSGNSNQGNGGYTTETSIPIMIHQNPGFQFPNFGGNLPYPLSLLFDSFQNPVMFGAVRRANDNQNDNDGEYQTTTTMEDITTTGTPDDKPLESL